MISSIKAKSSLIFLNKIHDYNKSSANAYLLMRLLSGIKEIIFKSDLFASGSLLRVKGEP
jgi:hypothetical protein